MTKLTFDLQCHRFREYWIKAVTDVCTTARATLDGCNHYRPTDAEMSAAITAIERCRALVEELDKISGLCLLLIHPSANTDDFDTIMSKLKDQTGREMATQLCGSEEARLRHNKHLTVIISLGEVILEHRNQQGTSKLPTTRVAVATQLFGCLSLLSDLAERLMIRERQIA